MLGTEHLKARDVGTKDASASENVSPARYGVAPSEMPLRLWPRSAHQATASLTAFTGLARTALLAGLAANFCFCLVNGLMPSRAGRAGFLTTTNLANP